MVFIKPMVALAAREVNMDMERLATGPIGKGDAVAAILILWWQRCSRATWIEMARGLLLAAAARVAREVEQQPYGWTITIQQPGYAMLP